ncbi:hypothetical protein TSAR_009630, partial [Trichomalopsis sarcophagae]
MDRYHMSRRRYNSKEGYEFLESLDWLMALYFISDCYYKIRSIRTVPGSDNDQFNWNFSEAREYLEALRNNADIVQDEGFYYMLDYAGDSGYARSPTLLTPILDAPEGSPASFYTVEHSQTQCQVERTIGILTGTWKIISRFRKLYYAPYKFFAMEGDDFVNNIIEEEQDLINRFVYHQQRIMRRRLRDISNPFLMSERYFVRYYRMPPPFALHLVQLVEHGLIRGRGSVPPHLVVLSMLLFFAEDSKEEYEFLETLDWLMALHFIADCYYKIRSIRIVPGSNNDQFNWNFSEAREYLEALRNNADIVQDEGFYYMLDSKEGYEFLESLDWLMALYFIADCYYKIRSIRIVRGSNNDQFNWNFSEAREYLEALRNNADIVQDEGFSYMLDYAGDSGYARSPTLLTPIFDAPEGSPASFYTVEHSQTRCQVERTIEILTETWKIISRSRKPYYTPYK